MTRINRCWLFLILFWLSALSLAEHHEVDTDKAIVSSNTDSESVMVQTSSELDVLLEKLAKAKLSKSPKIVEKIETVGGKKMLPLFETMLEGNLYYVRESLKVIAYVKGDGGKKVGKDVFSGQLIAEYSKKQVKKIKVNNKLRKLLRNAIARNKLFYGEEEERKQAAFLILDNINTKNVEALQKAQASEKKVSVKEAIGTALALYDLKASEDTEVRMAAVETLSGSLENAVKVELERLVAKDDEGNYIEESAAIRKVAEKELKRIQGKIEFYGFLEKLFFGLSAGSVLLLAAIGLAITFGVMGVINMAHGEMIMLGAYTVYGIQTLLPELVQYSIFISIPIAFLFSASVGMLIEYLVIRRLHGRPLETLLATFGVSLILMQAVRTLVSPQNVAVETPGWMAGSWEFNPVFSLTYNRMYILLFSLVVFVALLAILKKTSLGLRVRAVSQNRAMAKSLGVKTEWVDSMTFGLGSGIAGVAGVALSQITNVGPNLGQGYIIDSFMVVVFGGVGNILGTFFGAFSLGVANKFLEPVSGAVMAKILVLVFIILFIQRRPKGLFPQKGRAAE